MSCSRFNHTPPKRPVRIRCYHFNKPFELAFHSPQTKRTQADSVIAEIEFSNGSTSFGESAPRPYVTGETCSSVVAVILEQFAPILFDHSIDSIESVESVINKLEAFCLQEDLTSYHSALGAIDLALINALNCNLFTLPNQSFLTKRRERLRWALSVPFLPKKTIQAYFAFFETKVEIPIIKILASEDATETCERIELINRLFGPKPELRIEFNGKMSLRQVQQILERLAPFDIQAVEQPLPAGMTEGLYQLREQFGVSLVADESLVTFEDAERLAKHGAYNIFNIKVSKCGGLIKSLRIAEIAEQHGILCQVGTHVGESELLGKAGRRLAMSIPNFDCYGGGSEVLFSQISKSKDQMPSAIWQLPAEQYPAANTVWGNLVRDLQPIGDTGVV